MSEKVREGKVDVRRLSNVIGFDDGTFARDQHGPVPLVGAVFAAARIDGVLVGRITRDGSDSSGEIVRLAHGSRFREHLQLILLQGIAFGGFNVVDVFAVHERTGLPLLVVARRPPDSERIRRVLLEKIPDGARKWAVIEKLGPMQPAADVHVQRVGLDEAESRDVLRRLCLHGSVPEPLRVAHLIAGAIATGSSRGRA